MSNAIYFAGLAGSFVGLVIACLILKIKDWLEGMKKLGKERKS
jgi:hypothetical protein